MDYKYGIYSLFTFDALSSCSPCSELLARVSLLRRCLYFYLKFLLLFFKHNLQNMSDEQRPFVPKTPMDFQKLKLERLMANPDKPVIIPEMPKEKKGFSVPEFVRNVMGSSAGAGSGEFHVYRHLRRKEYTRQKVIEEKADKDKLDEEFRQKIEDNKRKTEEKTAKLRAKRLKKKQKQKSKAKGALKPPMDVKNLKSNSEGEGDSSENSSDDNHNESAQHSASEYSNDAEQKANSENEGLDDKVPDSGIS